MGLVARQVVIILPWESDLIVAISQLVNRVAHYSSCPTILHGKSRLPTAG